VKFKGMLRDLQVMIERLFDVPYAERFSLMCCGFRRFHHDSETMTSRRCGQPAVEMVRSIMKMITTDLPETICQRFDPESEECTNKLPARGTAPSSNENKSQLAKLLDTVFGSA